MIKKRQRGFTLTELMITVFIISILAGLSYPSYQEYVRRSARSDAKSALLENMQFLERNMTTNNCYHRNDANCAAVLSNVALPTNLTPKTGDAKYSISLDNFTASTYTLIATPLGTHAQDRCGHFTLTHAGQKGILNGTGDTSDCW
jgi:type IV pilus assembly protein PilE